ncbi:hypothetical protein D3C80_1477810 [compost metagenome]
MPLFVFLLRTVGWLGVVKWLKRFCNATETALRKKRPPMLAALLAKGGEGRLYQRIYTILQECSGRSVSRLSAEVGVSGMDVFFRALSGLEQACHCLECRVLALFPVTLQYLARLVMQVKPLAAGLEKRLAFCQLRLATLAVVMPGHGFRAQQ